MATVRVRIDLPNPEEMFTRVQGLLTWTCWKCRNVNRTSVRHATVRVTCPRTECRAVSTLLLGTMPVSCVPYWPAGAQPIIEAIEHEDWE